MINFVTKAHKENKPQLIAEELQLSIEELINIVTVNSTSPCKGLNRASIACNGLLCTECYLYSKSPIEDTIEFLSQALPKNPTVKEWSVGTYVVFLIDYVDNKKGLISSITLDYGASIETKQTLWKDPKNLKNDNCILYKDSEAKWFATKEEAEAYSKEHFPEFWKDKSSKEADSTFIPPSKFEIGDIVDSSNKGWQFANIEHNDAMSYIHSQIFKNQKITNKEYSKTYKNWWYILDNIGNWYSECALSLHQESTQKECLENFKLEFKVGDWVYAEKSDNDFRCSKYIPVFQIQEISNQADTVWLRPVKNNYSRIRDLCCRHATQEEIDSFLNSKSKEINTYGLKVGDKLDSKIISVWEKLSTNRYVKNSSIFPTWHINLVGFDIDRTIESFEILEGVVGFLVSRTKQVYLRAEGFKEFADNFYKSKTSSEDNTGKENICENCNGEGTVLTAKLYPTGYTEVTKECPDCNGKGFIVNDVKEVSLDSTTSTEYPEYYECIKENDPFIKGRIYKIRDPKNLNGDFNFIDNYGEQNGFSGRNSDFFKPSTKEAFDTQEKSKESVVIPETKFYTVEGEELVVGNKYIISYQEVYYCGIYNDLHYFELINPEHGITSIFLKDYIPKGANRYWGHFSILKDTHSLPKTNITTDVKELSQDELLAEAKRRYPIGTEFIDLVNKVKFTVSKEFKFQNFSNPTQLYVSVNKNSPLGNASARIYKEGKWAEIISKPKELTSSSTESTQLKYIVKQSDLIGEIENFPIEVVQKMVDEQVLQGNKADVSVFQKDCAAGELKGFVWADAVDNFPFWKLIIAYKRFDVFFDKYPKSITYTSFIEKKVIPAKPLVLPEPKIITLADLKKKKTIF